MVPGTRVGTAVGIWVGTGEGRAVGTWVGTGVGGAVGKQIRVTVIAVPVYWNVTVVGIEMLVSPGLD